ncbi:Uncharacterised protein [Mycobacterium tuberculosis]|nr:Uncharacterised protein [Mycobacterium tuberculosis]
MLPKDQSQKFLKKLNVQIMHIYFLNLYSILLLAVCMMKKKISTYPLAKVLGMVALIRIWFMNSSMR